MSYFKMNEKIQHIVIKSLQGKLEKEELLDLDNWIKESADNQKQYEDYKAIWLKANKINYTIDTDADIAWESFKNKTQQTTKKVFLTRSRVIQFAALLLIFFGLFFIFKIDDPEMLSVTSGNGIKKVELPDGSTILLNRYSKVIYPKEFDSKKREITFEGEGFFNIIKDSTRSFKIETKLSFTEILGTSFNLKAESDKELAEIAVFSGKVKFSSKSNDEEFVILTQDETGVLNEIKKKVVKHKTKNKRYYTWKDQKLFFDGDYVKNIKPILERYFNLTFEISPELLNKQYTGRFENPSLEEFLRVFCLSISANYSINDQIVVITPK